MWILDNISRARGFKEPAVPINNPLNFMDHGILCINKGWYVKNYIKWATK